MTRNSMNWPAQFQLHPLHIEDCRSNNERLKAEGTDNYLFLILKYIQSVQDGDIGFGSVYLFVGRDFLITVREPTCVGNEVLQRARRRDRKRNHPSFSI